MRDNKKCVYKYWWRNSNNWNNHNLKMTFISLMTHCSLYVNPATQSLNWTRFENAGKTCYNLTILTSKLGQGYKNVVPWSASVYHHSRYHISVNPVVKQARSDKDIIIKYLKISLTLLPREKMNDVLPRTARQTLIITWTHMLSLMWVNPPVGCEKVRRLSESFTRYGAVINGNGKKYQTNRH